MIINWFLLVLWTLCVFCVVETVFLDIIVISFMPQIFSVK